jgi:hypothetical protein
MYRPDFVSVGQMIGDGVMKSSALAVCGTYERTFTRKGDNGSAAAQLIVDSIVP